MPGTKHPAPGRGDQQPYSLGAPYHSGAEQADVLSECGWWTIAWCDADLQGDIFYLGVNIDDENDRRIYISHIEETYESDFSAKRAAVMFRDHAEIFDRIHAIALMHDGGKVEIVPAVSIEASSSPHE